MDAEIAIIGGTGSFDPGLLEDSRTVAVETPYGPPSDTITLGSFRGRKLALLPRHGRTHTIPPHAINFRANIWALKSLGVGRIISPSAVGSLQEAKRPGDLVFVDQFIDRTHGRPATFYDGGRVCHVSVADPVCPDLRARALDAARALPHHATGTYVCVQGPRFSTRAESRVFRSWGADVIGMTLVPEAVLAREAEVCYLPIATVTDWDVWKETAVTIDDVLATMKANATRLRGLLADLIPSLPAERACLCKDALKSAFV
ncbi:MAG: S-methyl-5'-thioadenosine phosphorylase [Candidatus Aenigmarchaeota archaeon]|nr:S-methyl-5'-thioadenosine phosphorylase [Candidatus Aenigmarchaeota archaeon]